MARAHSGRLERPPWLPPDDEMPPRARRIDVPAPESVTVGLLKPDAGAASTSGGGRTAPCTTASSSPPSIGLPGALAVPLVVEASISAPTVVDAPAPAVNRSQPAQ